MTADSWTGLVRALRSSTAGTPLDELVVLLQAERPRPHPIRNVRQIIYKSLEDVPQLLGSGRSLVESVSLRDLDAQPAEEEDDDAVEEESFVDASGTDEVLPDAGPVAMPPALEAVERTDAEVHAACVIQRAFKRVHKRAGRRKAELAESSLVAGCAAFFIACLAETTAWESPAREYRLRFLGPLPHLLVCLDVVHTHAQKQKKHVKKDLREAKHEKLEALDKQLTQLT